MLAGAVLGEPMSIPVLATNMATGERFEPQSLTTTEIDASKVYVSTIQDAAQLAGMQSVRPLRAGEPINRLHIKPATDVTRNTIVALIYRKPGMELVGNGQALEDGRIGQTIRVLNPESRATLVGTVVATNQVEVR
jgi:flagella basal body P-ring formation protein FlgA